MRKSTVSEMRILRFKLRTLLLIAATLACLMAYYGHVWRQLDAERDSVKRLEAAGARIGLHNEQISSWFEDQGTLKSWINWPVHALYRKEELVTRSTAIELTVDDYNSSFDNMAENIGLLANCQYLERLTLRCKVTPEELGPLQDLQHLKFLDLSNTNAGDKHVEVILGIKNLQRIKFGKNRLSVSSFEQLDDASIAVQHQGLKDYRPAKNFVYVNDHYYKINTSRSSLSGQITVDDESQVKYLVTIEILGSRYHASLPVNFGYKNCVFQSSGDWRDLRGTQRSLNSGGRSFQTPHHFMTKNVTILSRNKNVFHLQCLMREPNGRTGLIDVELPFSRVSFHDQCSPYTLQRAKQAMAIHYDLEDFEPARIDPNSLHPISYSLKPASVLVFDESN